MNKKTILACFIQATVLTAVIVLQGVSITHLKKEKNQLLVDIQTIRDNCKLPLHPKNPTKARVNI
jgi:hypothetical protein